MKNVGGVLFAGCLAMIGLAGCGGSSKPTPPPTQQITVSMSGQPATLVTNGTAALTATVANDSASAGVKWSATCGSSTACGSFSASNTPSGTAVTYTAPAAVPSGNTVTVTATSVTDGTKTATAAITITVPPPIVVSVSGQPSSLVANTTAPLTATVTNDSGNKGVTWTVSCGTSVCGFFNPAQTASGTATSYLAPLAVPTGNTVTVTATSVTDTTKTATATITITPPPISVSLAPPPPSPLTINTTSRITANVSNDSANAGVKWTVTCGGASCGSVATAQTASGTATTYTAPSAAPSGNTVTLTATSVTDGTKSASATMTIVGTTSAALNDGTYVYHLAGQNGNGQCFFAGAFTVAGGVITGGEQDFSDSTTAFGNAITAAGSSLTAPPNGNLQIVLATANTNIGNNGAITLRGTKVSNAMVLISEYDGYATGSGSMDLQTSVAAPSGGYAFVVNGIDIADDQNQTQTPLSIGGILNVSGTSVSTSGSIFDYNLGGSPNLGLTFASGTVTAPDSFGRVSFNLTSSNNSSGVPLVPQFILTGYIVGTNQIQLIESQLDDLSDNLAGMALGQGSKTGAFNQANLAGQNYAFGTTGIDTNYSVVFAGVFNFSPTLALSGPLAINDLANFGEDPITGGSVAVDATGRVTISSVTTQNSPFSSAYGFQMYLDGNGNAMLMGADQVEVSAGQAYLRMGTPQTAAGIYSITNGGFLNDTNGTPWSASGATTVTSGSYTGFTDYADGGTPTPNVSLTGTTNASTGVIALTGLDAVAFTTANSFLDYSIDNNRIVMLSIDANLLDLMTMETVTK